MMPMMGRGPLLGLAAAAAMATSLVCWTWDVASAKVSYPCPYSLSQTYSAALRLLRVDNGYTVTERDPEAAYIMFDYSSPESGTRVTPGAIEMVPRGDAVMVVVKLPQMPRYHEDVLLNALKRKLESEYGEPTKPSKPKPDERPDAGPDADSDAGERKSTEG